MVRIKEPLEGARKHKLMPLEIKKKLPKLYSQENNENPIVYLKLFSPYSGYTLYVTEYDGKEILFGYVTGSLFPEWGYASLKELASTNRNGLPLIERDMYFKPTKFKNLGLN